MTRKALGLAAAVVTVALVIVSLLVGGSLPPDMQLPIHWGISGEADGFAGKWTALLLPAALMGGVSLLFYFLPGLEPRGEGLKRSQGLYLWGWMALLLMGGVIELAVVSTALGWDIAVNRLVMAGVGVMLILIGNQLGKSRSMYLIGIRTPWTLASEEVWVKTHRLGGKLMVVGGMVMILAALLPLPAGLLGTVALAVVAVAALVPAAYSFLLWRRERGGAQSSR